MIFNTAKKRIRFREYRDDDLDGVRVLWRDDANWGDLTPTMWRQWYVDIPNGPALIVVGEDADGTIVAQLAMTPYRVVIDGKVRSAMHVAAPILSKKLHTIGIPNQQHPIVQLLVSCNRLATRRGIEVLFGMPRQGWMQLLQLTSYVGLPRIPGAKYSCMEIAIDEAAVTPVDLRAHQITQFTEEYDELWEIAQRNLGFDCAVVRDATYLNFRNGGHLCLETRDATGNLTGYVVVRNDGQVIDMLARDIEHLGPVIAAAHRYVATEAGEDKTWRMPTFRVMRTPILADAVRTLGFRQNKFRFAFACRAIDDSLTPRIEPRGWYLTPNG